LGKLTVAIVFGGRSVEHEISLISAKSILANLDTTQFRPFPVFIEKTGAWRLTNTESWLTGGEPRIERSSVLSPSLDPGIPVIYEIAPDTILKEHRVDVIFPILHGPGGEDGSIQGVLDLMGVPFVGAAVLGSSVAMDKIVTKAVLKEAGIPVLDYTWLNKHEWEIDRTGMLERVLSAVGVPCFVKSANLGSSVGITRVNIKQELEAAVELAARYSRRILVEHAVIDGREIEVAVLGNDSPVASLPGEIIPHREFYDYRAKYLEVGTDLIAPADLSEETVERLQDYSIRAFKALDCAGMCRADFFLEGSSEEIYLSEINTIPGFTHISMYPRLWEATGLEYSELITRLIRLAIERNEQVKALETDYIED